MMNHDEIREKLFDLYDRPLNERERQMVEGHLPDCPECRQAFEDWQRISRTLFALPAPTEAQEDLFVSKIMARLAAQPAAPTLSWNSALRWMVPLLGSSIAAVWFFVAALSGSGALASSTNVETAFSQDSSYTVSPGNGIILASYSSSDDIAP